MRVKWAKNNITFRYDVGGVSQLRQGSLTILFMNNFNAYTTNCSEFSGGISDADG